MQRSNFFSEKNLPNNGHGHIWSINTQVQPTTKNFVNVGSYLSSKENNTNQTTKKSIKGKKTYVIFPVMIWVTGLVLAGSEGAMMPYLNIAGAVIFLGASVWLGRILPCLEPDAEVRDISKKKVRHPVPAKVGLPFRGHDHRRTQGTHHLGLFGDKNLFFKGV
ncbi:hypothetical protein [uncultured Desulfobacter sp.]|uniref:hypothetical protein n=1 Tax=uncultured Desulfobacter sp. TaxID=240139 RepID=UPI002AA7C64E|nr:hypothetical protein [uncultured Desulfobacter sp.]